jgi:hypothetical protein
MSFYSQTRAKVRILLKHIGSKERKRVRFGTPPSRDQLETPTRGMQSNLAIALGVTREGIDKPAALQAFVQRASETRGRHTRQVSAKAKRSRNESNLQTMKNSSFGRVSTRDIFRLPRRVNSAIVGRI